jgi:ABC-type transporter Mla maintaining outer membrane lipid asymmetry permease subunit MlaE
VDRAYVVSTRVVSGIILLVGLVMIAVTLGRGGGPLALGVVFGVLFALLGAGRLWISRGA